MLSEDKLYDIEKGFWTRGADYYRAHTDGQCLTVFPEMLGLLDREKIAQSAAEGRWKDVAITHKTVLKAADDFVILSYEAGAKRADGKAYRALASTGYVRRGDEWKMAFHQQTPLEAK